MPDINGLRYPAGNVKPNIPSDMQALATDIGRRFFRKTANVTTLNALTDMVEGDQVYLVSHGLTVKYSGALNGWVNHTNNWIIPVLSGWSAYTTEVHDTPSYLLKDEVVWVRGAIKGGNTGTTIFNLPAGYRPSRQKIVTLVSSSGGSARLDMSTAGDVSIQTIAQGGSNSFVSLNFCYPPEQ